MEQKEEPPCKDGSPPACPPQIKTEPGIAVKREPGAATVKQESETARADDERMRRMLQEYRPPRRVVVRSPACQNLRWEAFSSFGSGRKAPRGGKSVAKLKNWNFNTLRFWLVNIWYML